MANWPHITKSTESLAAPVGNEVSGLDVPESKSPMKYAVDYKLVDEDGQIIEGTEYFIASDDAWAYVHGLDSDSTEGNITFRKL